MSDEGLPRVPGTVEREVDIATETGTTGHEWDGIKELNTPMPRWWLWVFYISHVWALGYIILYPAIPLINDSTRGLLGWSTRSEVAGEIDTVALSRADVFARIRDLPLEDVAADEALRNVAFRGGESAFKVNCVQCHGADASGSFGFANLNDDEWIWGGALADIHTTITHGVRYAADPDTRFSEMPAFGRDGILDRGQIDAVANHVLSMTRTDVTPSDEGAQLYADNCASCHGASGEGNHELGAPQLNDAVWLYSGDLATVRQQINSPRHGAMPAWGMRLSDETIKQLAIYVHGLGGGESAAPIAADTPTQ